MNTILFNRDQAEQLDDLARRPRRLGRSKLLWVDIDERSEKAAGPVAEEFGLSSRTRSRLASAEDERRPVFEDYGEYIHLTTFAPRSEDANDLAALDCLVGDNWVVTAHDCPVPVLEDFAARASGSGETGTLDGPGFLATLLEWVLGAYSAAFERMEQRLEEFDVQAMRGEGGEGDIETLVTMRRELGILRRALAAHRSALTALTHPELEALADHDSADRFQSLFSRFEATVQEARDARESIVGSFDVLIARTGHRTNNIMKVLTLASVLLLPGALFAGLMGMNFKVGLFQVTWLFYVIIGMIGVTALSTLAVAKWRDWI